MTAHNCIIDVKNVSTILDKHVIHEDISLCVNYAEVLAMVGASGSGKTTLLREMIGLQKPNKGSIHVFGIRVDRAPPEEQRALRSRWGVLFQQGALFSALSVFDNIALPLRELRSVEEDLIHALVMAKLSMVGLAARDAVKMPAELSGGMIKRVGLARALALEPELLFLDEPTSGLDPVASDAFVNLIEILRRELNLTVVMVTHDLDTMVAIADRVAVLADKRLIGVGTLAEVRKIDHVFVEEFFRGARAQRALAALE